MMSRDQVRQPGHAHGQKLRAGDRRGLVGQEIAQQLPDRFRAPLFRRSACRLPLARGQLGGSPQLAVGIPAELQIIGQDQVRQRAAIAGQLLRALRLVQRLADVLRLDVAGVSETGQAADWYLLRIGRARHAMRCGSLIAVTPGASASISAFSAGRCVCSVALLAA